MRYSIPYVTRHEFPSLKNAVEMSAWYTCYLLVVKRQKSISETENGILDRMSPHSEVLDSLHTLCYQSRFISRYITLYVQFSYKNRFTLDGSPFGS